MPHHSPVGHETTRDLHYFDAEVVPPPRGKKVLLLTNWGVSCLGVWQDDNDLAGWAPMPKVPRALKDKMIERQRACMRPRKPSA